MMGSPLLENLLVHDSKLVKYNYLNTDIGQKIKGYLKINDSSWTKKNIYNICKFQLPATDFQGGKAFYKPKIL